MSAALDIDPQGERGEVTADLFAFLTTEPNAGVAPIDFKAMPVILSEPEEPGTSMTAPWGVAKKLQRPHPNGTLKFVARGKPELPDHDPTSGEERPAEHAEGDSLRR
ncbi:hypothetical protein [Roseomonas chloroacetimidivorans]|uniref:hypothetical protein n=1 Tax=Roseomonas chloroacetimidivorans TaxID=1766656 RepID=UPI003C73EA39